MKKIIKPKISKKLILGESPEKIILIEESYKNSRVVLEQILNFCEKNLEKSRDESESKDNYKIENYALDQAHSNGYRHCLKEIINMLSDNIQTNKN